MKKQFVSPSSCPMCGKYIMEDDITMHRCDSLAMVIHNSADPEKTAKEFMERVDALVNPDYSWIKVKKYVDDETLSWEERYNRLMKHHEAETKFLINEVNKLKNK